MNLRAKSLLLFIYFAASCGSFETIEVLTWKDIDLRLKMDGGDATTSFYWKIYAQEKGELSEHLIFESYSTPFVDGIEIKGDSLTIVCSHDRDSRELIVINLSDLKDFVEEPVRYQRYVLLNTNNAYKEPGWVVKERNEMKKYNLN